MTDMYDSSKVYLRIMEDGSVEAFGDLATLEKPLAEGGAGGLYHMEITQEEWEEAGCVACCEDGRIVLGKLPDIPLEEQTAIVRAERDRLLRACDKVSPMHWMALTSEQQQAWMDYRQALLDIPQRDGFPWGGDVSAVPWPEKPNF